MWFSGRVHTRRKHKRKEKKKHCPHVSGDEVIAIDELNLADKTYEDVQRFLERTGDIVHLTIRPKSIGR